MNKKPTKKPWPQFTSRILEEISEAIRSRRRAICYRGFDLAISRDHDRRGSVEFERLDVQLQRARLNVALAVWEDGQLCIGLHQTRKASKALKYEVRSELLQIGPREVCARLEKVLALCGERTPPDEQRDGLRALFENQ